MKCLWCDTKFNLNKLGLCESCDKKMMCDNCGKIAEASKITTAMYSGFVECDECLKKGRE